MCHNMFEVDWYAVALVVSSAVHFRVHVHGGTLEFCPDAGQAFTAPHTIQPKMQGRRHYKSYRASIQISKTCHGKQPDPFSSGGRRICAEACRVKRLVGGHLKATYYLPWERPTMLNLAFRAFASLFV